MNIKMPCYGYYDEDHEECKSFCKAQKSCAEERYKNIVKICTMLQTQKNTVDRSQPIYDHFAQDFFEHFSHETKEIIRQAIENTLDKEDPNLQVNPQIIYKKHFIKEF